MDLNGEAEYIDRNGVRVTFGDGKPVKPKRPLTAYNIFFQHERRRLLAEMQQQAELRQSLASEEPQYSSSVFSSSSTSRTSENTSNNASTATTPTIGFANLGRMVADRWKKIKKKELEYVMQLAAQDKQRYKDEMTLYKKLMKELKKERGKVRTRDLQRSEQLHHGGGRTEQQDDYHPQEQQHPSNSNYALSGFASPTNSSNSIMVENNVESCNDELISDDELAMIDTEVTTQQYRSSRCKSNNDNITTTDQARVSSNTRTSSSNIGSNDMGSGEESAPSSIQDHPILLQQVQQPQQQNDYDEMTAGVPSPRPFASYYPFG